LEKDEIWSEKIDVGLNQSWVDERRRVECCVQCADYAVVNWWWFRERELMSVVSNSVLYCVMKSRRLEKPVKKRYGYQTRMTGREVQKEPTFGDTVAFMTRFEMPFIRFC